MPLAEILNNAAATASPGSGLAARPMSRLRLPACHACIMTTPPKLQTLPNAADWGLDFAMVATFIGMTIPYLINCPMIATVVVSGLTALWARSLPHQLGLIVAAIAGIMVGVVLENDLNKGKKNGHAC